MREQTKYKISLLMFITGLVLSGLTAFPILLGLKTICYVLGINDPSSYPDLSGLNHWVAYVTFGISETYEKFPFVGYGTDWLAFGHLVIALFFIKPLIEPNGNQWVLKYGLIACAGVIPLAIIMGEIRQIPLYWRLIDCSFGIVGAIPLLYCLHLHKKIQYEEKRNNLNL